MDTDTDDMTGREFPAEQYVTARARLSRWAPADANAVQADVDRWTKSLTAAAGWSGEGIVDVAGIRFDEHGTCWVLPLAVPPAAAVWAEAPIAPPASLVFLLMSIPADADALG